MTQLRLSVRARADLAEIARYTQARWGSEQAAKYLNSVEACWELAGNPGLGRELDAVRHGLRRMEHGSHVVFYQTDGVSILVLRILHKSMLPGLHLCEEEQP